MKLISASILTSMALAGVACGSGTDSVDPAALACDLADSPGEAVTATAEREGSPHLESGTVHTVTLPAGGSGFVHVEGPATLLLFAQDHDAVSALYHGDETTSELPTDGPNEFCPDALHHWELDLTEAGEWFIEVGPVDGDQVWLLAEDAGDHAHEDTGGGHGHDH